MSNQNDNDWLKNIKAVKTWTADKKVLKTIENCKEKYGTDDPTLKDMLEALASKRDVLTTQEYGKVNGFPGIILVIEKGRKEVIGIIKVIDVQDGTRNLKIDQNIYYIEGEKPTYYDKKWGDTPLKQNRDKGWNDKDRIGEIIDGLKEYLTEENLIKDKLFNFKKLCDDSKKRIYYGPPGTGKTRKAKIEAVKIVTGENCSDIKALNLFEGRINNKGTNEEKENDKKNIKICEKQIQIVQFHPSYSYNEFMETIDARGVNKDGVFKKIASDARNDPDKKYVLIIDEINRANVSEILGELLYGIEYRGQEITTGISNDDFSVPENLYIIGTMNTADRSLQALDYAVRRRFTFKKVKAELPDPKPPKQKEDVKDKGCYEIENGHFFCQNVFKKVQEDVMKSVARGIDPEDIMPGISYFLVNGKNKKTESDPDSYDEDHLKYKMKYELIPLLREYAKNGMFTKRKKLDINEKSLVELLYDNTYFEYLENNLSESEKK